MSLPPYSTFRTGKQQNTFPHQLSSGNVLSFTPPGFKQVLNVKFPDCRLAVCERCKKNYKTRDMCRVKNGHTSEPWTTAFICITLHESCLDEHGKYVDRPLTVRMMPWQPYCVKKPFDSKTPVCSACKKTNRTRGFCRERHKHRHLPWCTVYVMLSAVDQTDPESIVAPPSHPSDSSSKSDWESGFFTTHENIESSVCKQEKGHTSMRSFDSKGDGDEINSDGDLNEHTRKPIDQSDDPDPKAREIEKDEPTLKRKHKKPKYNAKQDEGDDIHIVDQTYRTFLAKISCHASSIHWLEMVDHDACAAAISAASQFSIFPQSTATLAQPNPTPQTSMNMFISSTPPLGAAPAANIAPGIQQTAGAPFSVQGSPMPLVFLTAPTSKDESHSHLQQPAHLQSYIVPQQQTSGQQSQLQYATREPIRHNSASGQSIQVQQTPVYAIPWQQLQGLHQIQVIQHPASSTAAQSCPSSQQQLFTQQVQQQGNISMQLQNLHQQQSYSQYNQQQAQVLPPQQSTQGSQQNMQQYQTQIFNPGTPHLDSTVLSNPNIIPVVQHTVPNEQLASSGVPTQSGLTVNVSSDLNSFPQIVAQNIHQVNPQQTQPLLSQLQQFQQQSLQGHAPQNLQFQPQNVQQYNQGQFAVQADPSQSQFQQLAAQQYFQQQPQYVVYSSPTPVYSSNQIMAPVVVQPLYMGQPHYQLQQTTQRQIPIFQQQQAATSAQQNQPSQLGQPQQQQISQAQQQQLLQTHQQTPQILSLPSHNLPDISMQQSNVSSLSSQNSLGSNQPQLMTFSLPANQQYQIQGSQTSVQDPQLFQQQTCSLTSQLATRMSGTLENALAQVVNFNQGQNNLSISQASQKRTNMPNSY